MAAPVTPPKELADRLAELDAKATPGPWYAATFDYSTREDQAMKLRERLDFSESLSTTFVRKDDPNVDVGTTGNGPTSEINSALIVALRNDAKLIVAALRLAEEAHDTGSPAFETARHDYRFSARAARGGAE